jgi:hypothetical protein
MAQFAPQGPQAAYEGQNVIAVSLIANPHRDLEPLRSVLTQKAGELSILFPKDVRALIQHSCDIGD